MTIKPVRFRGNSLDALREFPEAVYVLHCFQKKTERMSQKDIELARKRYKELMKERT